MTWNPLALATALQTVPEQNIDVTNNESALIIKLNDYGDLQINILFTSRQMIIETFICPVSSISNPDEFNTFLLRNQKMMPLSSVGISSVQQEEYYIVFGALSLKSSLEDILLEITSLVDNALDLAEITGVMAVATLAAYVLWLFRLPESNIIMIYILGILLSSYIANKKIYALYSSLISVFAFNFFFTEPYFSLKAYDKGYPTTFVMLFLVGLFTATLTRRLKQQSRESAKKAYRTEILLENSQKLRRCKSKQEVWTQVAGQAGKLLNLSLIIYPMEGSQMSDTPLLFPRKGMDMLHLKTCINRQELAVAQWVAANHHRAGACTHTLPDAKAMYLPIQDARDVKGVMGILLEERRPIQEFEYGLLIAMLNETGVKLQDTFLE